MTPSILVLDIAYQNLCLVICLVLVWKDISNNFQTLERQNQDYIKALTEFLCTVQYAKEDMSISLQQRYYRNQEIRFLITHVVIRFIF